MTRRKKLLVVVLTLAAVVVLAAMINLGRTRPSTIVVGPVELGVGIPGVVDKNTTRRETIAILGAPLRRRETWKEAQARGSSDIIPDYFAGVYAEVEWFNTDRACSLNFDLDDFAERFASEQVVVVRHTDKTVRLSRKLRFSDVRKPEFGKSLGFAKDQIDPSYYSVDFCDKSGNCLMVLHFSHYDSEDDAHLRRVWFSFH